MKEFIITQQKAQLIMNVLVEIPAKLSIEAIDILRGLPEAPCTGHAIGEGGIPG